MQMMLQVQVNYPPCVHGATKSMFLARTFQTDPNQILVKAHLLGEAQETIVGTNLQVITSGKEYFGEYVGNKQFVRDVQE